MRIKNKKPSNIFIGIALNIFSRMASTCYTIEEIMHKLGHGFFNLSVGEKWNTNWDLYEHDLTMEEFTAKVCGWGEVDDE